MEPNNANLETSAFTPAPARHPWRTFFIIFASVVVAVGLVFGIAYLYNQSYTGKVYTGVKISSYDLGGMTRDDVVAFIENVNNRYIKEAIQLQVINNRDQSGDASPLIGVEGTSNLSIFSGGDTPVELFRLDSEKIADEAVKTGRTTSSFFDNLFQPLVIRFVANRQIHPVVITDPTQVKKELKTILTEFEAPAQNAKPVFSGSPSSVRIVPEQTGQVLDYDIVFDRVLAAVSKLSFAPVVVEKVRFEPEIKTNDVSKALGNLDKVLTYGDISLNYVDSQTNKREEWVLKQKDILNFLEVRHDDAGFPIWALSEEALAKYFEENIRPAVDVAPEEARFTMDNNRVKEFKASRTGIRVDEPKTYSDLDAAFRSRNYAPVEPIKTVPVSVTVVEPEIKTADVNNLGITSVIGVGVSTFKDSHTNRIKNIANAVKRLNGLLIKPGEEFSANRSAGPYTLENGFLPEQVIKGDKILPEVGGGMCQIGTTLFRMAMNSGMDITQRQNHSLVVSYYADPVNGNPGTDATLYEPLLDFKFMNDTGHYLLLETSIDYKKQELVFTLWGTPDGRSGSYTHPLVSKWIPAGEQRTTYDDSGTLQPGEEKCQNAFRGAVASFTYSRVTPAGEKLDRVFTSYYRSLPKICVIGVEKGSCAGQKSCKPASLPSDGNNITGAPTTTE